VLGLGVSMYDMYVFTKKMYINMLYDTSFISAYCVLDSRECKCLEYYLYCSFSIGGKPVDPG
jgi:hypothetical protein